MVMLKPRAVNFQRIPSASVTNSKFRAKVIDISVGGNEIVLSEEEAKAMNLQLLDRVKIKTKGKEATAIVNYSL